MTTTSYPITGENVTHAMWSKLEQRHHQGVDSGMTLSLSSTEATVAVGRCSFMGFALEVTVAEAFTLAAVVSTTVYVVGVLYDPADEAEAYGPLTLVSGIKGAITVPGGGALWPLYEVTRQPAQALTLATVKSYRVTRASLLFKGSGVSDPDPAFAVGPQVVVSADGVKALVSGSWVDLKSDTGDRTDGITTPSDWSAAGTTWRILDGWADIDIYGLLLTGSGQTSSASGNLSDFRMLTLPAAVRPRRNKAVMGSLLLSTGASIPIFGVISSSTGDYTITATAPGITVSAGARVTASISYAL